MTTSSYSTEKNFSNVNMKLLLNNTLGKEIDLTITTDRNDIISVGSYINTLNFTDYNNQAIDIPIEAVTNAVGETIITMTLSHSGKTFIKKIVFIVY